MKSSFLHAAGALALCLAILSGYGVWYAAVAAKSAAVASLQSEIDTKTETMSRVAAARATLSQLADDEAIVQGYFVPEAGIVPFIDAIQTQGRTIGASVSVLSVGTAGTASQPSLVLSLSINGSFDTVMRTVGSIEFAPYALSITDFSVSQDAKEGWHADLKISVGSTQAARTATTTVKTSPTAFVPTSLRL